ncbi:hypothetical protein BGZ82_004385 [Podila clonocystis]|nr:hypothetical protein BGZ82_004385 [Podila clonocystis]
MKLWKNMDLPEIRTHLAQFLNHKTLSPAPWPAATSTRALSPISGTPVVSMARRLRSAHLRTAMAKNGHFIRLLIIETVDRVEEYLQYCPNFEKIYFRFPAMALSRFKESTVDMHGMDAGDVEGHENDARERAAKFGTSSGSRCQN